MRCYLCRSKRGAKDAKKAEVEKLFIKNGYQLFRCRRCGLIFYNFKKDYREFLKRQYSRGYFTGDPTLDSYFDYGKDKGNIIKNMTWYLKQILKFKKKGKILDIGCAYGYFMEIAQKEGFEVFGIDPSDHAIKKAQKKFGQKAVKAFLSEVDFPEESFEVVVMFDVFEHLKDPKSDLLKIRKILKDNGLLLIATGDTSSFWAKLCGRRWTFYNPPQHIFYFNKKNIKTILEDTGFRVLKIMTNGKWLSLRYMLHLALTVGESKIAKAIYPLIKDNFLGAIPLYLKFNDNMLIFATKLKS